MTRRRSISPAARARTAEIKAHGEWWRRKSAPSDSRIRLMDIVEGYVVARRKGAAPMLFHVSEWAQEFEPVDSTEVRKP